MSRNRFYSITSALSFATSHPPAYKDKFWRVREMIAAWNKNMAEQFTPSWMNCLDESMSTWTSQWTCPGFMFVPRKPWPFGNEYHTICCAKSGVMWALEIVEGKDAPPQVEPEHNDKGKTVGLLLRLTRQLYGTGKVVILDSGFCVLQGIIELAKHGVFASALIKKRRFWPKFIPGDEIKAHFELLQVGTAGSIRGQKDGVDFDVYCLKEPDYTMMIMSTYGTNLPMGATKKRVVKRADNTTEIIEFRYPEVIHNHYQNRHCVDDHNANRHAPISIETTWATKWWEC